jgi:hypothetical protein
MLNVFKRAGIVAALAVGSMTLAPTAEARGRHYRHHSGDDAAIAIGAGVVGLALGAALASDRRGGYNARGYYYDDGYYYARPRAYYYPRYRYYYRTYPRRYYYNNYRHHYRGGWDRGRHRGWHRGRHRGWGY